MITIVKPIEDTHEHVPKQRQVLEEILKVIGQDDLSEILFESDDLNVQLSSLKMYAEEYVLAELSVFKKEIEHIFNTLLDQLDDAVGYFEDEDEDIRSILLSVLLREIGKEQTPGPVPEPKSTWSWPVINVPESKVTDPGYAEDWNTMSPLKMFGYTVGKTNGWDAQRRKRFLDDFMTYDLPNIVTETYGDFYGEPNSVARLKATAQLFASLITSAKRKRGNSMRYAIDDWLDDLGYLKSVYYEGKGLKFYSWPTTSLR